MKIPEFKRSGIGIILKFHGVPSGFPNQVLGFWVTCGVKLDCGASTINGHLPWSLETGSTPHSSRRSTTTTETMMVGLRGMRRWGDSLPRGRRAQAQPTTYNTCPWGGAWRAGQRQQWGRGGQGACNSADGEELPGYGRGNKCRPIQETTSFEQGGLFKGRSVG